MRAFLIFVFIFASISLPFKAAAQDDSSGSKSHKKSSSKQKSTAKKKPVTKTPAKKTAATKKSTAKTQATAVAPRHTGDYQLMTVRVYTNPGDVYQTSFPAVLLSDKFAAVRIDSANSLEDLSLHSRIFVFTPKWVQMYPVDVEMESNWVLLKSDDRLPSQTQKFATNETTEQMAKIFRYESTAQWVNEIASIRGHSLEKRSISSLSSSGHSLIEGKVQAYGDHIAQVLQGAQKNIKMDGYSVAPNVDGLPCQTSSPIVNSEELQSSILGANAVTCEAATNLQLAQNFSFTYRMQAGAIKMKYGEATSEYSHLQILQNIAARETENMHKMSAEIKYSTPASCESSHLSDKNIDVYYCTRGMRGFHNLSDSVVVVGHASGNSYLYNMMRTSGFSPDSTQSILQANLNILEANP